MAEIIEILQTILICFGIPALFALVPILKMSQMAAPATAARKQQWIKALYEHIEKTEARDITVKHVGIINTYLEHFTVNYYDAQNSWQVRHVIRRQIPGETLPPDQQFYWDDPVITYEREVSAEISQAKQQLINDLDLEIHELQQAITSAKLESK